MADDKKVRISVDDKQLQNLRSSTEELARGMIMASRQYSTSSKEVLKDIEDQIKAIERRNSLDEKFEQRKAETARRSGTITPEEYKSKTRAISMSSSEDKLQVQLLRDVIEAIKQTSKDEIREDRIGVERRVKDSKRIESLTPKGDAEEILKETIQHGLIGEVTEGERDQRTRFRDRGAKYGQRANQAIGTAAGSQNEFYLAAAAIAWIPMVGQGLSQLTNRVISSATRYEKSLSGMSAFYNTNMDVARNMLPSRAKAAALGLSRGEFGERDVSLQEAAGGRIGQKEMFNILAAERVKGIKSGTTQQLAGVARYGEGYTTIKGGETRENTLGDVIETFERASKGNNTVMMEMLSTFIQTSNRITSMSGGIHMGLVGSSIAGISEATGATGSQLGRITQGVQGMGKSQSPIVRSMMLRELRKRNPSASFFDIQSMMENPMENIGAVSGALSSIKEMTGGGDLYKQALYSTFGGVLSRSDIGETLKRGDFASIAEKAKEAEAVTGKDFTELLPKVMGQIEKSSANVESMAQETGKQVVDFMDKAFAQIQEGLDKIAEDPEEIERRNYDTQKRAYKDGMAEYYQSNPQ